jgi:membrane-bound lytic murein transglycosylase B
MWMRVGVLVTAAAMMASAVGASKAGVGSSWTYLIDKLIADRVDRARVVAVFGDPRLPAFDGLEFSLGRRESTARYRGFLRPPSVAAARDCREQYDGELRRAEKRYGVPASVVAALLHVETRCGRNTGAHVVLTRLARLAMANEPANVRENIRRHTKGAPRAQHERIEQRVRQRARELEGIFYPEVLAMFRLADQVGIDEFAVRGSGAGAFGIPQFLPSSYLRFAVDGDGDGRVSLYNHADAIASAANYLAGHGWRRGITRAQQRQVIWSYNHSDPYVDTVLQLAARVQQTHPSRLSLADR